MNYLDFVDKAILPIFFTFLYIVLYLTRRKIFRLLKKMIKNKELIDVIKLLASNFKLKVDNFWLTTILPITLAVTLDIFLMWIFQIPMKPYLEPLWFQITVRSFLNPISEEVVARGFIFGCFFLTTFTLVEILLKKQKLINSFPAFSHKIWIIFTFSLQTYLFASWHENPALFNWIVRLSSGFLYGLLYLAYKRNLLPPIVAHITHNLVITLGNL
jgi:membrane protease YdiL (CAAX protease family)